MSDLPIIRVGPWVSSDGYISQDLSIWDDPRNPVPVNCANYMSGSWPFLARYQQSTTMDGQSITAQSAFTGEISLTAFDSNNNDPGYAEVRSIVDIRFSYLAAKPFELDIEYEVYAYAEDDVSVTAGWNFDIVIPSGATSDLTNDSGSDTDTNPVELTEFDSGKIYLPATPIPLVVQLKLTTYSMPDILPPSYSLLEALARIRLSGVLVLP